MNQTIGYTILESAIPGFTETNIISQDKKGRVVAEAILQVADEVNRNGRMYPYDELIPQLSAPRTLELLEAGYLRGEMGHPISDSLTRQQTIDDTRTCTQYLTLFHNGPVVKATYRCTNNAFGQALNEDLLDGCKPSFSLRALGTVDKENGISIVRNLKIVTWDSDVVYPSHPSAYTQKIVGVVNESGKLVENTKKKTRLQTLYENTLAAKDIEKMKSIAESGILIPITNQGVVDLLKHDSANIKSLKEMFDFAYTDMYLNEDGTKVTLKDNSGYTTVVNVEQHIHNELMDYCVQQKNIRDNY